jgi:hypothetical protein
MTPLPSHMSMIYNHFYFWLCSQNLPLLNITMKWVKIIHALSFLHPSMKIKNNIFIIFVKKIKTSISYKMFNHR